jgi:hypothetical protein
VDCDVCGIAVVGAILVAISDMVRHMEATRGNYEDEVLLEVKQRHSGLLV